MEVRVEDRVLLAERAMASQQWSVAREHWSALACSDPRNKGFRANLAYSRARERLQTGDRTGAVEQLEWVLRLAPEHTAASAMLEQLTPIRFGLSRLLLRAR